jgi:hypothetical protein
VIYFGIAAASVGLVMFLVPLGVFDVDGGHLGIGDDNAAGVLSRVELRSAR